MIDSRERKERKEYAQEPLIGRIVTEGRIGSLPVKISSCGSHYCHAEVHGQSFNLRFNGETYELMVTSEDFDVIDELSALIGAEPFCKYKSYTGFSMYEWVKGGLESAEEKRFRSLQEENRVEDLKLIRKIDASKDAWWNGFKVALDRRQSVMANTLLMGVFANLAQFHGFSIDQVSESAFIVKNIKSPNRALGFLEMLKREDSKVVKVSFFRDV